MTTRNRRGALAYLGAFEAVLAILIGGAFGWWIDSLIDSAPVGLLIGLAAGFGAFILLMVRLSRKLEELRIEEERDRPPEATTPSDSEGWDDGSWGSSKVWDDDPWDRRD